VLLALSGTELSEGPAVAARLVAERLGLSVEILTVIDTLPVYGAPNIIPPSAAMLDTAYREERLKNVRSYIAPHFGSDQPIHVVYGPVTREIIMTARDLSASIVVLGASPHRRRNRIISGERAAQVLGRVECPVLSVAPGFNAIPNRIVVGVDFGPSSVRACIAALRLLGSGGTLTMVHAVEPVEYEARLRDSMGRDFDDAIQSLFTRLRKELQPHVGRGVTVESTIMQGSAVDAILEAASGIDGTVIAVGTHGPSLVQRFLGGSVAASVLHSAEQSVLAVPPPSPAEALVLRSRIWGTAVSNEPGAWADALAAFSSRNTGRPVKLEIDDPELGSQILERGYELLGVSFDPKDERITIMVGDPKEPTRHLTHAISSPDSLAIASDLEGVDTALEVTHGGGYTILQFLDRYRSVAA
jgi:nucleotide-binding universal stress UspA family protein